jgi:transposase
MSKRSMVCAGIDTGKRKLDVALKGKDAELQVDNAPDGHEALSRWLRQHRVKRVGIEASGGYEQAIVTKLRHDGFVVVVFQPAQVRAYARFHLQRAKNDKIDAGLIAQCTADTRKIHAPPDPRLVALAGPLTLIEQIEEDIARLKNRRESCREERSRQYWTQEIKRLQAIVRAELKGRIAMVRQHHDLATRFDLIASVDGIGPRTALAVLVRLPEIGRISREQVAALVGLAPYDDDSGDQVGVRHIEGGRERLRGSIYAAALPASLRWNRELMALYDRLIARGKLHKVALVACARKLLIFVNTVVARGTPWVRAAAPSASLG